MSNLRAITDAPVTMRCKVVQSRPFTFADRMRILFGGRVWISIAGVKPHATVVVSTTPPRQTRGDVGV